MNEFYKAAASLYSAFVKEKPRVEVPAEYVNIVTAVMKKVNWKSTVCGYADEYFFNVTEQNNKVLLALSGGLDSVYLCSKLLSAGYEVICYHIEGLNKSYSKTEAEQAQKIAAMFGCKFVKLKFKSPQQAFPDNPFKNQLVLSLLIEYGLKKKIYRYAVGSDWTTPLAEATVGFTVTDAAEVYREYWAGVQKHFPQAELIFINDNEKKYERLNYLYSQHKEILNNVSSCVSPLRFREHLHTANEEKFGVHLMKGRCGSCYKCAMEYIMLVEAGHVKKDSKFYSHCWHVLATSKTAHRPDLFDEKLPIEKRKRNLLNYGS